MMLITMDIAAMNSASSEATSSSCWMCQISSLKKSIILFSSVSERLITMLIKKDIKALKYARGRRATVGGLFAKYPDCARRLIDSGYITFTPSSRKDADGFPIDEYPTGARCWLTDLGVAEVEAASWFNLQYVLTMILVPILIGVSSGVLTSLILTLLSVPR